MIKKMNKLEEAFERIKDFVHDEDNAGVWTTSYLLSLDEDLEVLKKIVDEKLNKPTLEEVKKEWEELGYSFNIYNDEYHNGQRYKRCVIYKEIFKNKKIIVLHYYDKRISSNYYWETTDEEGYPKYVHMLFDITLQEHQLITKTMKALGWFDDENR